MPTQVINMHELVPKGLYCYDEWGTCPAWGRSEHKTEQENIFCTFMMIRDWEMFDD
jgi:hypothetical protein